MIIAISTRVTEAQNYLEKRNSIAFDFISYLEKIGITPLIIPNNLKDLNNYLSAFKIKGIILTGGNNVDPKKYKSISHLSDVYPERDETEKILFNYAIDKELPILGVCRGFHFINVEMGGKLTHNISGHVDINHTLVSGNSDYNKKEVNSFHNHGIKGYQLSTKLNCIANTNDGFVEVYENKIDKILGFQWHPEREYNEFDSNLIKKHFAIK